MWLCETLAIKLLCYTYISAIQLSAAEELKPNYIYGEHDILPHLTSTTELGGPENCRQVRSNTYDDPLHLGTSNGGAAPPVPTYETVHSAKKEMLNASGPPVLNPVYGPTPTSPISPNVPLKSATNSVPNPVYSETGPHSHQLPDVSPLSPVYAAVGKSAATPAVTVHYAYAENHTVSKVPTPSDEAEKTELAPLYEELQTRKKTDSMGTPNQELGEAMVRNESYGLLTRNIETGNSSENKNDHL